MKFADSILAKPHFFLYFFDHWYPRTAFYTSINQWCAGEAAVKNNVLTLIFR